MSHRHHFLADEMERMVMRGHARWAERVEAALRVHAEHLDQVIMEERYGEAFTRTVRCVACDTIQEVKISPEELMR